jgi:hypothetical protein
MDDDRLRELHDHLAATGERPVERSASRWLGEAEAIAGDIAHGGVDEAVKRERLGKIDHLLENVDSTGDEVADDHVESAEAILDDLLA